MAKINFKGRRINLFYYSQEHQGHRTNLRGKRIVPIFSSQTQVVEDLSQKEYDELEQKTLAYLLRKAIENAGRRTLVELSGIKQDIIYGPFKNHLEATLKLSGIAIYN